MNIVPTAEDWITLPLSEIVVEKNGVQTGPFGSQLHKKDYVQIGTPIITVEHLGENRILHNKLPRVSDEDKERLAKYTLQEGDIVFSRVGSVDRRSFVRSPEAGWLFSGRCLRIRAKPEKIDPLYLSYYLGDPRVKQYVRSIAVGATMPSSCGLLILILSVQKQKVVLQVFPLKSVICFLMSWWSQRLGRPPLSG